MAEEQGSAELNRLEDFIALAKQGKQTEVVVTLRKQIVTQKAVPEEAQKSAGEADMYLLIADYDFQVGGGKKVSKIYVSGFLGEPLNATRTNLNIANDRLKMDYMRLRDVNIIFEEVFF